MAISVYLIVLALHCTAARMGFPCSFRERGKWACHRAGVADRVSFREASAEDIEESDFDLVTCFDCLHDMGDPRAARPISDAS